MSRLKWRRKKQHVLVLPLFLLALYIVCAVLNSIRSLKVKACDFKNSLLVISCIVYYPYRSFCRVHNDCKVLLEVLPHTST